MPCRVLILMILINSLNVFAYANQGPSTEEWNPASAGTVTTWTAPFCGKGKFVIQPFIFYNRARRRQLVWGTVIYSYVTVLMMKLRQVGEV